MPLFKTSVLEWLDPEVEETVTVYLLTQQNVPDDLNLQVLQYRAIMLYFIFIVPCIIIFYGMTNRCNNVQ